ncbi:MAG: nicotinate-nucleotide diphosphorylase [Thermoproteus sp. AZ2]|jgi:nicotinate-nucleotide pyrophosphorylase (carboxylating)|uniref:Nicotinate-nucleotide diphosphorylase n=1 Tax=Thermoproteus sp. AZ2 TaxID=1609232 RepID=A0ACC6UYE5_9CREN
MLEARLFAIKLLEALKEDLPFIDVTSAIVPRRPLKAYVLVKASGVLAGVEEAVELLKLLGFDVLSALGDGQEVKPGDRAIVFRGEAPEVLKVERTLLNLLMHASGIATMTRRIVERARAVNPKVRVAATRKTLPFLRYIEKKAVALGGGDPHRYSLSDAVLIKDNHIKALGGVAEAVKRARGSPPLSKNRGGGKRLGHGHRGREGRRRRDPPGQHVAAGGGRGG